MPYIPNIVSAAELESTTRTTLANAIASDLGFDDAPVVIANDVDSLHAFGNYVCDTTGRANSFLSALINRIALVIYTSKSYKNPLAILKRGILDYGESIEEIFVALQNGEQEKLDLSNSSGGHSDPFNANIPDVKTAFHLTNLKAKYSKAIRREELRQAFTSFAGLDMLVSRIVDGLYNEHNFDEYLLTKYKLAQAVLSSVKNARHIDLLLDSSATDEAHAKAILTNARRMALTLPTYKDGYNEAGVLTTTPPEDLAIFISAEAESVVDVNALASAFNLSYAEFIGKRISIDNFTFTSTEISRICAITGIDEDDFPITDDDIAILEGVDCVLADTALLQIYDTVAPHMSENFNGSDEVWNYWLHVAQCYSISPFMNCVVIANNPDVTVTNNLTSATSDNSATAAPLYRAYKATITAASGKAVTGSGSAATLTIGGVSATSSYLSKSTDNTKVYIDIPATAVTGDIVITVTAV